MTAPAGPPDQPDPAAARFDEWASQPATPQEPAPQPAPQAAPIQPAAAPYAQPDLDQETLNYIDQRETRLRQEIGAEFNRSQNAGTDEMSRMNLWNQFQDKYPEFAGMDDFIASSFQAVTGGRIPEVSMFDTMLERVHDHATTARDTLIEQAGYEVVDEEAAEGRTGGIDVSGASEGAAPMETPGSDDEEDDDSTLTSELVEMQGNTEFYVDTTPDMLTEYKKPTTVQ